MNTINTQNTQLPDAPLVNFKAMRTALKAHGVTLVEFECEIDCRCDVCGAEWTIAASLDCGISRSWWECTRDHEEESDDAHA